MTITISDRSKEFSLSKRIHTELRLLEKTAKNIAVGSKTIKEEGLGDLYEGLLEKNASEKKSGAGQYFTPQDLGEEGRFRCFSREEITKRGENLDISWLRDESLQSAEDLSEPDMKALTELLDNPGVE